MLQLNMVKQLSSITMLQSGMPTLMFQIMMEEVLYTGTWKFLLQPLFFAES
jgi:hypothetical protein